MPSTVVLSTRFLVALLIAEDIVSLSILFLTAVSTESTLDETLLTSEVILLVNSCFAAVILLSISSFAELTESFVAKPEATRATVLSTSACSTFADNLAANTELLFKAASTFSSVNALASAAAISAATWSLAAKSFVAFVIAVVTSVLAAFSANKLLNLLLFSTASSNFCWVKDPLAAIFTSSLVANVSIVD